MEELKTIYTATKVGEYLSVRSFLAIGSNTSSIKTKCGLKTKMFKRGKGSSILNIYQEFQ